MTDSLLVIYNNFCLLMTNKEILKKKIIYRSVHRGTKEMDILLGNFVKRYINSFNYNELLDLKNLLSAEDELLYEMYFKKEFNSSTFNPKISQMFKDFKI